MVIKRMSSYASKFFPKEPTKPQVSTAIPGPKAAHILGKLNKHWDPRTAILVQDLTGSHGNYLKDADGNMYLDMYSQIASIAVGYNNPGLISLAKSEKWVAAAINRPALGVFPPTDWADIIENSFMKCAPKGLDQVFPATCGSSSVEIAFKTAFMHHQSKKRGQGNFTQDELETCMENKEPGAPRLSIMSFENAFHGRLLGSLSTTRSKPIHKLDIPAFPWPKAPFPHIKYPLSDFQAENKAEEERCLVQAEHLMKTWPIPIAAIIIEPIQGEGGDNRASPAFYQALRDLTRKHEILMIVDEVQTGVGCTGKFWGHEHWNLSHPPDIVTFSKKMQSGGVFHKLETRAPHPYRNFNTWMGDPIRAYQAEFIISEIRTHKLLETVTRVGDYLMEKLTELSERYPIKNVRGQGTFMAFDCEDRDKVIQMMRSKGVNMGGSGTTSVRLRPMLCFEEKHADVFLERLEKVLKEL